MGSIKNIMTVDVEDYFQVSAFENIINREEWDNLECRVERNTLKVIELFDKYNVKATFFVLAWVAERYPELIRIIVEKGHELANHGYDHKRITSMDREKFKADLTRSKNILEDISGVRIKGYRAPSYSIVTDNLWAHEILAECGFLYSSSVYPIKHDLYGIPDAPRFKYKTGFKDLIEIPISTIKKFGKNFPCGGGGFFRLYPYSISKWAIDTVNREDKQPCIFYFHPWEMDPYQPRINNIPIKTRIRHYLNISKTHMKLEKLLQDYEWARLDSQIELL